MSSSAPSRAAYGGGEGGCGTEERNRDGTGDGDAQLSKVAVTPSHVTALDFFFGDLASQSAGKSEV